MKTETFHTLSKTYASRWLIFLIDLLIIVFNFFVAYLIRYNLQFEFDIYQVIKQLSVVILFGSLSIVLVGFHKSVVRYTGFGDIVDIIISVNLLATLLIILSVFQGYYYPTSFLNIPGSIIYIHLLLNILGIVGFKLFVKSIYNRWNQEVDTPTKILVFGAGDNGTITYEAITNDTASGYEIVGFIDDSERKVGKKINALPIYAMTDVNAKFVKKTGVEEVIIAAQNIEAFRLLQISEYLFDLNLKVKIVPPIRHWIGGDLSVGQIKPINIDDLLGREPIKINNTALFEAYEHQTIFVTGAAGSIGSELARKLSNYNHKQLILIDSAESCLYNLEQEFISNGLSDFEIIVADVRDYDRMELLFQTYRPQVIFHAAAYKHVPLMENNPYEAVSVNIIGTKNISNLSVKYNVDKFVFISTDKAVNPTNVMGASKRVAELYINCLQDLGKTKFITTRFGNVLGSNGSVIPLFKKQIENGGPITVTHPDITRYFMTISEACQLVIEAAAMGQGGEIFVFDMGKAVKIIDLARNVIVLSGLRYPNDIDIKIVGLRPGEKIYEELLADGENTIPTYHEKIMIAKSKSINSDCLKPKIALLCQIHSSASNMEIVTLIKSIVPEYKSNNSQFTILDHQTQL